MSNEKLSEPASVKLMDRALLAEAELAATKKLLASERQAKEQVKRELESQKRFSEIASEEGAQGALNAVEYGGYWKHQGHKTMGEQSKRLHVDLKAAKEQRARWHNDGVVDGTNIVANYLAEGDATMLDRVVDEARVHVPDSLTKAVAARAFLVQMFSKAKKAKK